MFCVHVQGGPAHGAVAEARTDVSREGLLEGEPPWREVVVAHTLVQIPDGAGAAIYPASTTTPGIFFVPFVQGDEEGDGRAGVAVGGDGGHLVTPLARLELTQEGGCLLTHAGDCSA